MAQSHTDGCMKKRSPVLYSIELNFDNPPLDLNFQKHWLLLWAAGICTVPLKKPFSCCTCVAVEVVEHFRNLYQWKPVHSRYNQPYSIETAMLSEQTVVTECLRLFFFFFLQFISKMTYASCQINWAETDILKTWTLTHLWEMVFLQMTENSKLSHLWFFTYTLWMRNE